MSAADDLIKDASNAVFSRLRIPIVVTYLVILTMQNWDIILFFFTSDCPAIRKIEHIKAEWPMWLIALRAAISIFIAIGGLIVFTWLNTILNEKLQPFYSRDKSVNDRIQNETLIKTTQRAYALSEEKNKDLTEKLEESNKLNEVLTGNVANLDTKMKNLKISDPNITFLDFNDISKSANIISEYIAKSSNSALRWNLVILIAKKPNYYYKIFDKNEDASLVMNNNEKELSIIFSFLRSNGLIEIKTRNPLLGDNYQFAALSKSFRVASNMIFGLNSKEETLNDIIDLSDKDEKKLM